MIVISILYLVVKIIEIIDYKLTTKEKITKNQIFIIINKLTFSILFLICSIALEIFQMSIFIYGAMILLVEKLAFYLCKKKS